MASNDVCKGMVSGGILSSAKYLNIKYWPVPLLKNARPKDKNNRTEAETSIQKNTVPGIYNLMIITPSAIACFKLIIETPKIRCEICSKLTTKTP